MENNNTCVWVKASERLPEKEGYIHIRRPGNNPFAMYVIPHAIDKNVWLPEKYEWLDESPQQSAPASGKEVPPELIKQWEQIAVDQIPIYPITKLKYHSEVVELKREMYVQGRKDQYAAQFQGQQSAISNVEDKIEVLREVLATFLTFVKYEGLQPAPKENKWYLKEEGGSTRQYESGAIAAHWLKDPSAIPQCPDKITQLFSNSQPVSNLLAELQLMREVNERLTTEVNKWRERCEAAEILIGAQGGSYASELKDFERWQQLKEDKSIKPAGRIG